MLPFSLMVWAGRLAAIDVAPADYQRLLQRVAAQEAAIESFRGTLQDLRLEVARMRSATEQLKPLAHAPRPYATPEQLRQLAEQIRTVERNRIADRQQILGAIEGLRGLAKAGAAPAGPAPSKGKATGKAKKPAAPVRKAPAT
ncbi:MAG: hypothetical protein WCR07_00240 [Verrucomicrobiota bacterium]|jgi:hypothetical protein